MIFRYIPMWIHSMMKTTVAKKLQVTLSNLKQYPFLPSLSFWNKVSSNDSEERHYCALPTDF